MSGAQGAKGDRASPTTSGPGWLGAGIRSKPTLPCAKRMSTTKGRSKKTDIEVKGASRLARAGRARKVVAITGAASFLGKNLVGLLEEDDRIGRIVAVDLTSPSTAGEKTRVYEADLTQPSCEEGLAEILLAERVDCLVHLAFLGSPSHARAWAHELESVGTMRLLNAARQAAVRKLVLWSQTMLYGAHPTNPNFLSERHPLRAPLTEPFFADKIEAEAEANRFAERTGNLVTILRTAPVVGPTVKTYLSRYLARRMVPTMMGFDPLWQFLHEADAIAAFKLAIFRDVPGTFNIVGDGVLPLTTVIKLAGRVAMPVPHPLFPPLAGALWVAQLSEAPPGFLDYLRYICIADGEKAAVEMGFRAAYTTREALLDYTSAQRLRDVRLLSETPA
ncbi:MAG TPA: NAD-dependent epimerase/dehydratase family protein [Polyangiaceae bacterium]|nr:NAD-dependent epimerase/dehydratase family protein [Polyangiaceae bacterium]